MFVRFVWTAVICLLCGVGCGSSDGTGATVKDLVDAERRFARDALAEGVKSAFLKNLADDAVVFRPYPVSGREWFLGQPETSALLSWEPVVADVSDAGDLGYTTGPWSYSAEGAGVEPNVFGEYASVWRKPPKGHWRVVIDVGTSHEQPPGDPPALAVPVRDRRRNGWEALNTKTILSGLLAVEAQFAEACRSDGTVAAYSRFSARDIRYCPADGFPVSGKDAVVTTLSERRGERRDYSASKGDVARSGDLGYVYGCGEVRGDESGSGPSKFCYLRVWTRGRDGGWRIALDVSEPVPSDAEPPDRTVGGN